MKSSQLREFYLAFVYHYGAIYSDDAYKIIKGFYPDLKEETLIKDLKKRVGKMTRGYMVLETEDDNIFVISNVLFTNEDLDELFYEQGKKEFFVEKNLDVYLGNSGENFLKEYKDLRRYLERHIKANNKTERIIMSDIYLLKFFTTVKYSFVGDDVIKKMLQEVIDLCEIENIDKVNTLLKLIMEAYNNTPMITNRGYSPKQMREKEGSIDINNLQIQIGNNMKNMMLDGDMDAQEMLEHIKSSDMPAMMKNNLIEQLEKVIMMKNNTGKA